MSLTLDSLLNIEPFSWVALLCCAVNGLLIGAERQTRGKPKLVASQWVFELLF